MAAVERSSEEESQPVLGAVESSELVDVERGATSVTQKRLFLVASNVPDKADLVAATKAWVTTVQYDYERDLEQDALRWIGATAGRDEGLSAVCEKFGSIALVLHGSAGEIKLTEGVSITTGTAENPEIALFLTGLGKMLAPEGRIDVFGCDVAGSPEGRELIAKLESLYSVNIAASDDITTAQKGGDMVLETDGVELVAAYFDEEKLKEWEGKLNDEYDGWLELMMLMTLKLMAVPILLGCAALIFGAIGLSIVLGLFGSDTDANHGNYAGSPGDGSGNGASWTDNENWGWVFLLIGCVACLLCVATCKRRG